MCLLIKGVAFDIASNLSSLDDFEQKRYALTIGQDGRRDTKDCNCEMLNKNTRCQMLEKNERPKQNPIKIP